MASGWLFLGISTLICIGAFLNGLRFWRMNRNTLSGKTLFGQPIEGSELPVQKLRQIGKIQMIAAPIFLAFAITLSFGLLGPVEGIQTIKLR